MTTSSGEFYGQAEAELSRLATAVQQQKEFSLSGVMKLAAELVSAVHESDQLVLQALSSPPGPPLITNLINVGILATKIGKGLGYYGQELERFAVAGLVHDIGLFAIPQALLTKSSRLTAAERAQVEQHPELGYQLVRRCGSDYVWLADVVRQAHERWKGQGYPKKLQGRQISEFAQVIGVVDVFDALISPRPYRRRLLPHEAVRELLVVERGSFPREIIKALVEQLSVYPLGTKVWLSTGEEGVVVRVNPRYPLRPVVRLTAVRSPDSPAEREDIDLSRIPLAMIVETLDAPAVDRVTFTPAVPRAPAQPDRKVSTSDEFSALLESLDAIATAIQHVVETRGPSAQAETLPSATSAEGQPSSAFDPGFQKEILGLFALEAHEWLRQIQGALKKLDTTPPGPVRSRLTTLMLQGISNLSKSAATVNLPAIEQLASGLVPVVLLATKEHPTTTAGHVASLQTGLSRIRAAIQELPQERIEALGEKGQEPKPVRPAEPVSLQDTPSSAQISAVGASAKTSGSMLEALRRLQAVRGMSLQPMRDVLTPVIDRVEHVAAQGGTIDLRAVQKVVRELDRVDDDFLVQVTARVPDLLASIATMKTQSSGEVVSEESLRPILDTVRFLREMAGLVEASTIAVFLQGLGAFLAVAAQRPLSFLLQRLDAVESRLQALVPMAQQWVDVGRLERTAILDVLSE